jgi:hypothetical protein
MDGGQVLQSSCFETTNPVGITLDRDSVTPSAITVLSICGFVAREGDLSMG